MASFNEASARAHNSLPEVIDGLRTSSGEAHPEPPRFLSSDVSPTTTVPLWNLATSDTQQIQTTGKLTSHVLRRGGLVLHLKATTWAADSHGLFDYESRSVHIKVLKCNCFRDTYYIVRVGTDVQLLNEEQTKALCTMDPRTKFLAQLSWSNGTYNLIPMCATPSTSLSSHDHQSERLWLVVRTLKDRGVTIAQGDIIKLGRYRIKIKEIVLSPEDVKAMGSRRFLCHTDEDDNDDDDCETIAPDPPDIQVVGLLAQNNDCLSETHRAEPSASSNNLNPGNEEPATARSVLDSLSLAPAFSATPSDEISPNHLGPTLQASPNGSTPSSIPNAPQEGPILFDQSALSPQTEPVPNASAVALGRETFFRARSSMGTRICRICLCEAEDDDIDDETNPLVAPCECKGSMKWVHLMCLRTWMAGRLNIRNDGSTVCFFWRSLECELCKVLYPPVVKVVDPKTYLSSDDEHHDDKDDADFAGRYRRMSDSKASYGKAPSLLSNRHPFKKSKSAQGYRTVELFEIPRPEVPYIILEPRGQQNRGLHVVSLANNKTARLGRGHESDIRLADISVSRLHAVLRFQTPPARRSGATMIYAGSSGVATVNPSPFGCFVVEDNRSKFGTLIEVKKPFRLDPQSAVQIAFQVGRTVLTFTLKRRWRFMFPACLRNSQTDISVLVQQIPNQLATVQPTTYSARTIDPNASPRQSVGVTGTLESGNHVPGEGGHHSEQSHPHLHHHHRNHLVIHHQPSEEQGEAMAMDIGERRSISNSSSSSSSNYRPLCITTINSRNNNHDAYESPPRTPSNHHLVPQHEAPSEN